MRECKAQNSAPMRPDALKRQVDTWRMRLMKRLSALCRLLLLVVSPLAAQDSQTQAKDAPQNESASSSQTQEPAPTPPPPLVVYPYEVSGGYSLRVFTEPNYVRIGLNGGYGAFEYKILSRLS